MLQTRAWNPCYAFENNELPVTDQPGGSIVFQVSESVCYQNNWPAMLNNRPGVDRRCKDPLYYAYECCTIFLQLLDEHSSMILNVERPLKPSFHNKQLLISNKR